MLSGSGFTNSQTDSLLSSFVLSDDSPPSKAEVTLELVTALEPIKKSLSDVILPVTNTSCLSPTLFFIGSSAVTIPNMTSAADGGETSDSTNVQMNSAGC